MEPEPMSRSCRGIPASCTHHRTGRLIDGISSLARHLASAGACRLRTQMATGWPRAPLSRHGRNNCGRPRDERRGPAPVRPACGALQNRPASAGHSVLVLLRRHGGRPALPRQPAGRVHRASDSRGCASPTHANHGRRQLEICASQRIGTVYNVSPDRRDDAGTTERGRAHHNCRQNLCLRPDL
jgi:hypothetical protein